MRSLTAVVEAPSGTATILFTDVVGSTEMQSRIGDVAADDLRRRHDALLGAVVVRHNGEVVKGLGDGILAAFGSASDAVAAAHDIQGEISRAGRQLPPDRRIEVRIGLSAGDVAWDSGDCHGTPVVTAARLCDAASGGVILCDDLVRGLARGRTKLNFALVGELELKGLPDPVAAYEVPWSPAPSEVAPLPAALRPHATELPFAGRDAHQLSLAEAWKHAQVDGSRIVLLVGEPGIGKTRLAAELAREAHRDGALVLLGRCDEYIAAAHAPWIEAMRTLVAHAGDAVLSDHSSRCGGELARLVPELARHVPDMPAPTATDPDTERLLLFDAVVDALATAARALPVLLMLDDVHWADAASVDLLRHVAAHLDPDAHVLVLVTYRDTDVDRTHALARALVDLNQAVNTERIVLKGLDGAGIRDLLEAAGGSPLDAEGIGFAQRLVDETDGNPLFVRQLLRHLVENGSLIQRDGRWVGTVSAGEAGIPEGVRDLIGQRLSRLSDATNELLRTAAVIGREFDIDLVAAAAKVDDDRAVDLLDEAVTAQMIEESAEHHGQLSFAHALVRQTLLEELSTNKRVRLHRRIAELLDQRGDAPIDVLAHHYCEAAVAGVAQRAIECACEAAENAGQRLAWEDAIRLYARALEAVDALDHDDPGLRAMVLTLMATVEQGAGDPERARGRALDAAELARRAGDSVRLTEAGIAYQGELGMWAAPSDPVSAEIIREGLAGLAPDRLDVRARALSALAQGLILAPGAAALTAADEAIAAARDARDELALRQGLLLRAWAVRGALPATERARAAEDAIGAMQTGGDRYGELAARYHLANARLTQGDLDAAAAEFLMTSESTGALAGWAIVAFRASLAIAQGRFHESIALSDEAHELGSAVGDTNDGIHAGQRWQAARAVGDFAGARRWHEQAQLTAIGSVVPTGVFCALDEGDEAGARAALRAWTETIADLLPNVIRFFVTAQVGELVLELDLDLDELDGLQEFADYAERFPGELFGSDVLILSAVDVARGCFAAAQDRLDDAVTLIETGHALHQRLELRALEVESALALAQVLTRRDQPGDRERAVTMLAAAAELARTLGMAPAEAKARALLA